MTSKRMTFGDDQAKTNPWRDDRLNVLPLAERLAKVIFALDAPNGYVIGLNGVWGSGKSTLVNFACEILAKYNAEASTPDDQVHRIDFRPLMVSGHQDLVAAFFKVLSESLGPRENWWRRTRRKLLKRFGVSSDAVLDALAKVAVAADVGVTSGVASGVVSIVKRPLKDKIDDFLKEPSLQAAHQELSEQLKQSGKRFLVTIDDIDRLTKPELMSLLQMVKTVGQLPNVVYLLSYDRQKLREAFDEKNLVGSPSYAEKIIQQEVELPKPTRNALLKMLDAEIAFMTGPITYPLRWSKIVTEGVHRWIQKPRDVLLLTNALKFSWPSLEGEFDPSDLLAMEGLRVFDPEVFQWVKENRDFLFRSGRFQFLDATLRRPHFEAFRKTIEHREDHGQILELLTVLFVGLGELIDSRGLGFNEPYSMAASRRGIATEAGYNSYFALSPSADAVPKRVIDEVTSDDVTEEHVVKSILSFVGKRDSDGSPMLSEYLQELSFRFDAIRRKHVTEALFNALFRTSVQVLDEPPPSTVFLPRPGVILTLLIQDVLRYQEAQRARQLLLPAVQVCPSVSLCAELYVSAAQSLGLEPVDESARPRAFISHELLNDLGNAVLDKMRTGIDSGALASEPFFRSILLAGEHLDESKAVRKWLTARMHVDASVAVKVAHGLVAVQEPGANEKYVVVSQPEEALYDMNQLFQAFEKHLAGATLSNDDRKVLLAVVKWLNGHTH